MIPILQMRQSGHTNFPKVTEVVERWSRLFAASCTPIVERTRAEFGPRCT